MEYSGLNPSDPCYDSTRLNRQLEAAIDARRFWYKQYRKMTNDYMELLRAFGELEDQYNELKFRMEGLEK